MKRKRRILSFVMAMLLLFALAPAEGLVPVAQAVTQGEIDQLKSDAKELANETSSLKIQLSTFVSVKRSFPPSSASSCWISRFP